MRDRSLIFAVNGVLLKNAAELYSHFAVNISVLKLNRFCVKMLVTILPQYIHC